MKKIFLIGDSIRYGLETEESRKYGYGYHVRNKLKEIAEVYQPDDNCRFIQYTLRYLPDWANSEKIGSDIDVVHWNNGLWDVLRQFGDEPLTSPEQYEVFLIRVYSQIKKFFPKARIIFALTTPVIEEMADINFFRKNEDIDNYNEIAKRVLVPLGVEINDLNSVAKKIQPSNHLDWVHFNEVGASILADKVIEALKL